MVIISVWRNRSIDDFHNGEFLLLIVAESMDEIVALTRTALSELALWPNLS